MTDTKFKYVLRDKIKDIFENYRNSSNLKDGLIKNNNAESIEFKESDCLKCVNCDKKKISNDIKYSRNKKKILNDIENNNLDYNENSIFSVSKNYLIIENYTSIVYENCEEKLNIILANKHIPEGLIEIQIKGKESFIIPCSIYKNILSCFLPQLEKGMYQLFFFINKEILFIKLLRPGLELAEDSKFLPLHVIEVIEFSHCLKRKNQKNKNYNISINNNIYTNKELLKIYNSIYKKYRDVDNENKRNPKIAVGNDYKLQNISELHFYNFLKCYKDEFVDHSFRKNKNKIDTNNLNFVSQLNLEKEVQQSRIPILYKRLLYDNCIYENKMVIMHFHSKFFEYDPFNLLSVHVFTKNELKDGYTIFAFNLIPVFHKENVKNYSHDKINEQTDIEENNICNVLNNKEKKEEKKKINTNYISTLLMLKSDEKNCADVRMWKYIDSIECKKNNISNNFYINKNSYEKVHCPIPSELINNKNVFKKYSEGLKISEKVSIFFENWNDDILPVQKFVNLFEYDLPHQKIMNLSNFIKNKEEDFLLFNDFYLKNYGNKEISQSIKDQNNLSTSKKSIANENHNNELGKNISMDYLLNNFVSFVIVIEGKIYHSVIPINKLLLLFIINYWMHFIGIQKKKKKNI